MVERGSQLIRGLEGLSGATGQVDHSFLEDLHSVPGIDSEDNSFIRDVVGNKADTASTALVLVDSLMSYIKGVLTQHLIPAVDSTDNVVMSDVLGGKADTASTATVDTDSVMSYVKGILNRTGVTEVFKSKIQATVVVTTTAGDKALPSVTATLSSTLTVKRITAAWAWRKAVDSSTSVNAVNGASQDIQVRSDEPGCWTNAIQVTDNSIHTGASATEGGMLVLGDQSIQSEVDATDVYEFQWNDADVDGNNLTLYDVQTYLIVEYH